MAARTITAANTVVLLAVTGLFAIPQRLRGFAADDVFDVEDVDPAEVVMGVDGRMSAGFVNVTTPWSITFQGDSPSIDIFEQWIAAQKAAREIITATGTVTFPGLGKSFAMTNGVLTRYKAMSAVKKVVQPRTFQITWESVDPASI